MARAVLPYEPTWLDKHFRKALSQLPVAEQRDCASRLADLVSALKECGHPIKDPRLAQWRPSPYNGVVRIRRGHLAEYRFRGTLMRVIACYFDERPELLLVTATLTHDHDRMKRLLKEHGSNLESYFDED